MIFSIALAEYPSGIGLSNMNMRRILFLVGLSLIVIGLGLIALGVDGLRTPIPCLVTCPSIFSSNYTAYWEEIYVGVSTVAVGVAMVLASKRLKTEAERQVTARAEMRDMNSGQRPWS